MAPGTMAPGTKVPEKVSLGTRAPEKVSLGTKVLVQLFALPSMALATMAPGRVVLVLAFVVQQPEVVRDF